MRARLLLIGVVFLTLPASGWGGMLAAALCPHMAQDNHCCPALRDAAPPARGHDHEAAERTGDMGDMDMSGSSQSAAGDQVGNDFTLGFPEDCGHCLGRPEMPGTPLAATPVNHGRQDDDATAPRPVKELPTLKSSFGPPVAARQHAPPGAGSAPRHVLIQTFLI